MSSRPSRTAAVEALGRIQKQTDPEYEKDDPEYDEQHSDDAEHNESEAEDDEDYVSEGDDDEAEESEGDEYEGEESEGDEEKTRRTKSQEEKDAEAAVCSGLGIAPKQFAQLRSAMHGMYTAVCQWFGDTEVTTHLLDDVFQRLRFDQPVSADDRRRVVLLAHKLVRTIDLPYQSIADTFVPLHAFNGGILTRCSTHMRLLFGVALMVDLMEQILRVRAAGTTQEQELKMPD